MKKLFLIFSLFLVFLYSQAQTESSSYSWMDIGIAANAYKGDLQPSSKLWSSSLHLGFSKNKGKRTSGHFNLMIGTVAGQNPDYLTQPASTSDEGNTANTYFKTSFVGLNYHLRINLIRKKNFRIYVSQGAGILRYNPFDENNEKLQDKLNTRAKNESFSNLTASFPTSAGIIGHLNNGWGLGFQATILNQTNDYIDNISQLSDYKKGDKVVYYRFSVLIPFPR